MEPAQEPACDPAVQPDAETVAVKPIEASRRCWRTAYHAVTERLHGLQTAVAVREKTQAAAAKAAK